MTPPPVQRVSAAWLRQLFNRQYRALLERPPYRARLLRDGHPSAPAAREPFCTRSQILAYLTPDGARVAVVHRYLRTDGTLGASGTPDPKALLHEGVLYSALVGRPVKPKER